MIRKKLRLPTQRTREGFLVALSERSQTTLEQLDAKYGIEAPDGGEPADATVPAPL